MSLKPTSRAVLDHDAAAYTGAHVIIEWPPEGKVRMREVVRRSNVRRTFKFPSHKAGRMIHCESKLERDACPLHEVSPEVLGYCEQPARLHFLMEGQWREHVPDLLVRTRNGPVFREIKSNADSEDPFVLARARLLAAALPAQGYRYELLRESDIRREPRLANARVVLRFGRAPVQLLDQERARQALLAAPEFTWGDVRRGSLGPVGLRAVCRLILSGSLPVDWEVVWSDDTPVLAINRGGL